MFLEKCGQFFFLKMRPHFFFALIAAPLLLAIFFLSQKMSELQDFQDRFLRAARKEPVSMEKKERKERFLNRYSQTNPYFLNQVIESFPLLESEKKELEFLLNHPGCPESKAIKERLLFIKENKMSFQEEKTQISQGIKEVQEHQRYPVQMDESDLKQILSWIEDLPIERALPQENSPQLLIKDFRLKRQQTPFQKDVFEIEMDLIKREFF